jgi:hypothetical protein
VKAILIDPYNKTVKAVDTPKGVDFYGALCQLCQFKDWAEGVNLDDDNLIYEGTDEYDKPEHLRRCFELDGKAYAGRALVIGIKTTVETVEDEDGDEIEEEAQTFVDTDLDVETVEGGLMWLNIDINLEDIEEGIDLTQLFPQKAKTTTTKKRDAL